MKKVIHISSNMLSIFIIGITIMALLLPYIKIFPFGTDYLVQMMFLLLIIGIFGLIINKRVLLLTGLICSAALALFLKNASNVGLKLPKANKETGIYVAHLNLSSVSDINTLKEVFSDSTLEVISFQEFTPEWGSVLPQILGEQYPFAFQFPRADPYGKAVFSRHRITHQEIIDLNGTPNIEVTIDKEGNNFFLFSVYLTPALDKFSREKASGELAKLDFKVSEFKTGAIVMGEFNQVYWSNEIIRFRNSTGLLNSRREIMPNKIKIPYDHIFYTPDMECFYFQDILDSENNHIGCKGKFQFKSAIVKR